MLPFLSRRCSQRYWIPPIVLCGVLVLISIPLFSQADDPPQDDPLKHDPIGDGIKAGDQDQQIKDIDRQLGQKNLTPEQRTKLESDKARYEERINNKKGKYLGEDRRIFDRTREARGKQHEKKKAEEKLKNAPAREQKRIQRTINRLTLELGDYPEDIRKALEGTPLAAAPAPTGESYAFTGLVLQMDWTPPPSTTPTDNLGDLLTLTAGYFRNSGFTPENFSQSLQNVGADATGNWLRGDDQSPPVLGLNRGKVDLQVNPGYTTGNQNSMYTLAIGAGFNSTSVTFFQEDLAPVNDIGTRTINNNPSLIIYFPLGVNPWSLGPPIFGRSLNWSVQFGLGRMFAGPISNFQESDADRTKLFNEAGESITGWELNAGFTGGPAPGLTSSTWPKTEAWPIPHLDLEVSR